ncbi:hypothetical protein C4573_05545 [Candidatus Woesearchaeota archaeon]|nr:MAG: hypothetical protein C4573_05545 [Candidatus Woesearchaeota archaeon]
MDDAYEKIVPTAWLVAYRRKFSDIPFAKEIFDALDRLRAERFFEITDEMLVPEMAPQYEARYKLIDRCIHAQDSQQILELAAGFAGRGMDMAQNSRVTYVEFDLPRVMQDKEKIAGELLKGAIQGKLYFEAGNALDYDSLYRAAKHFEKKPITVINEGLLRYLNFEEKTAVAQNVHKLLEIYGGVWITSDITLKKILNVDEKTKAHNKTIAGITGITVDKNRFEDENHAMAFFENLGYSIERHSFMEVKSALVSPRNLNLSDAEVNALIDTAVVYIMRLK